MGKEPGCVLCRDPAGQHAHWCSRQPVAPCCVLCRSVSGEFCAVCSCSLLQLSPAPNSTPTPGLARTPAPAQAPQAVILLRLLSGLTGLLSPAPSACLRTLAFSGSNQWACRLPITDFLCHLDTWAAPASLPLKLIRPETQASVLFLNAAAHVTVLLGSARSAWFSRTPAGFGGGWRSTRSGMGRGDVASQAGCGEPLLPVGL